MLARAMRKQNLPLRIMTGLVRRDRPRPALRRRHGAVRRDRRGPHDASVVVKRLVTTLGGQESDDEDLAEAPRHGRDAAEPRARRLRRPRARAPDILVKLAKCCTPVPGDEIVGFVTRGSGVSVHRGDCTNVAGPDRRARSRIIEVEWAPTAKSIFLVQIQVEALDRPGCCRTSPGVLSDHHVNILSATVSTSRDRLALSRFTFEMGDPKHLDHVLSAVRGVEGVFDVYRVTG